MLTSHFKDYDRLSFNQFEIFRLDIIIFIDLTFPIMIKNFENTNTVLPLKPDLGLNTAEAVMSHQCFARESFMISWIVQDNVQRTDLPKTSVLYIYCSWIDFISDIPNAFFPLWLHAKVRPLICFSREAGYDSYITLLFCFDNVALKN